MLEYSLIEPTSTTPTLKGQGLPCSQGCEIGGPAEDLPFGSL